MLHLAYNLYDRYCLVVAYFADDLVKEGNVLFNDTLNTFYLGLYGRKTGYMASDIW